MNTTGEIPNSSPEAAAQPTTSSVKRATESSSRFWRASCVPSAVFSAPVILTATPEADNHSKQEETSLGALTYLTVQAEVA